MNQKGMQYAILIVVIAVLIAVAAYVMFKPTHLPKAVKINTVNQPTLGNPKAKVQVVAFEDLKCHNCARFNTTLFPKFKKEFIDTGKVRYTMINLAFIPGSLPAANAARCIYEQNKAAFFAFVKYVYFHQPAETVNWATIPKLMEFAGHIKGVDTQKLSQCLVQSPYTDFINNNMKIAAGVMGNTIATPTLYVNGMIVKPLTMARLTTLINVAERGK